MPQPLVESSNKRDPGRFVFQAAVTGGETKGHFTGVASSTSVSKQGDLFFSQSAQAHMQGQGPKPLVAGVDHTEATVNRAAVMGMVKNWGLSADGKQLTFEGDVDPALPSDLYDWYCSWFDQESDQYVPISVSIGGWIPQGSAKNITMAGRQGVVKQIDALNLDHLLLCRRDSACNPDAAITAAAAPVDADWLEIIGQAATTMIGQEAEPMDAPVVANPDTDAGIATSNAALGVDVDAVREMVRDALRQRYRVELTDKSPYVMIEGLYVDEADSRHGVVHYEVWTPGGNEAQYIISWELNEAGTDVTLGASPVEVIVKETLVTPDGKPAVLAGQSLGYSDFSLNDAETVAFFADMTGQADATSGNAWKNPTDKERQGMPDSCFLYVDGDLKLFPVYEVGEDGKRGKVNARALGAAVRRLKDVKGHGAHSAENIQATVRGKLIAIYKQLGKKLPATLAGQANEGDSLMEQPKGIWQKLAEAFGQAAAAEVAGEPDGSPPAVAAEPTGQAAEPKYVTAEQCEQMIGEALKPVTTSVEEGFARLEKLMTSGEGKVNTTPDSEGEKGGDAEEVGEPNDSPAEEKAEQAAPAAPVVDPQAQLPLTEGEEAPVGQAASAAGDPGFTPEDRAALGQFMQGVNDIVSGLTDRLVAIEQRGAPTGQTQQLQRQPETPPVSPPAGPKSPFVDSAAAAVSIAQRYHGNARRSA